MKKINILFFSLLVLFFSCTNLEEELYHDLDANNFYKTKDEVSAGFMRAYAHLREMYGWDLYYLQELSTDEACFPQKGRDGYDGGKWQRLHWHKWTDQESIIKGAWDGIYKGIGFCNSFLIDLGKITVVSDSEKEQLKAETRALRALYYSYLIDLFGDVPIVKTLSELSPAKTPRAEVFKFVETELTEVKAQLLDAADVKAYGRISQQAVNAILARLYLNAEVYTGTDRYQDCIATCDAILKAGNYELEANWQAPFAFNNENSAENIFVIPLDQVNANFEDLFKRNTHWAQRPQFDWKGGGGWNGICTVREFISKYDTINDKRCKYDPANDMYGQFMWGPQYDLEGAPVIATNEFNGQQLVLTLDLPNMVDNKENAGARNIKYKPIKGATGLSNDFVLYRLAEVYFNMAEAALRKGLPVDERALAGINKIRARAGVPQYSQAELSIAELYEERAREMCYETLRRPDMVRHGDFIKPMWDKDYTDKAHYNVYPIPFETININPNLEQNPAYAN
jgi:hypothetical protein